MTQFRKIVEDQVQQIMHQPEPKVLTDEIKAQVLEKVKNIVIDDLQTSSSDEYYAAQINKFIDEMKSRGIIEVLNIPSEELIDADYLKRLQIEIEVWLSTLQPVGTWDGYNKDLYR